MRRSVHARLTRLESRVFGKEVHSHVWTKTPDGHTVGAKPSGPCMIVIDHGDDEQWAAKLAAQQARLRAELSAQI